MKRLILISLLLFQINLFFGQVINITDPDQNPIICADFNDGGAINFVDDGAGSDYGPNRRDTITICPDLPNGPKITASFGINAGFSFNIDPSDTMYVFDGNSVNAPFLGSLNSGISAVGASFESSFENNPSGCLTFVFHSDATAEGSGWDANISCGNPVQPFEPHLEAFLNGQGPNILNPIDTGYINLCLGDSVLIVTKPIFPYSLENTGFGYSQNMTNVNFEWEVSGNPYGGNNDSIWYKPLTRNGFYVGLKITDAFPNLEQTFCKIRVSQLPLFFTAGPQINPICAHTQGILIGGATALDTAGVDFPPGSFILGGVVAGLTYLPDGSGLEYSTTITMSDFADTAVFSSSADLQSICVNMEHSFLGDLEVWLTCPNGTEVALVNAFSPGHIPGGFGGGGTFLGSADDNGNGTPGIGSNYCFSSDNATFGTMGAELTAGNTITSTIAPTGPSMNPDGVYLPEINFNNFVGCPLNGDWTITVRDNQSIDDGYIFSWEILFDPFLFPNYESYKNVLVAGSWANDPTIVSGQNDTALVVFPDLPGVYDYTFVVTDDYGCNYDTTVLLTVKDTNILVNDILTCNLSLNFAGNIGSGGNWSFFASDSIPTFVNASNINTTVNFPSYGIYNLVYSDPACPLEKDSITIDVGEIPQFKINSDFFNCPGQSEYIALVDSLKFATVVWDPTLPLLNNKFEVLLNQGTYNASLVSTKGCTNDTTFTIIDQPKIVTSNYSDLCGLQFVMANNTVPPVGSLTQLTGWSQISGPGTSTFASTTNINTTVDVTEFGEYEFIYAETKCDDSDTVKVSFIDLPKVSAVGGTICAGTSHDFDAISDVPNGALVWNTGQVGPLLTVSETGIYTVTATNFCGSTSFDVLLETKLCDVAFPNVFTPNPDATNNLFQVLIPGDGVENFVCQIFNRWGNLLYEYNDVYGGWDGKVENGKEASPGTYFYKFSAKTFLGDEIKLHGAFQLIR